MDGAVRQHVRQEVLEVVGFDDRVVTIIHETGTAQSQAFDNRAIYLIELMDGKFASLRTMDMDHDNIHRFWAAVTLPAAVG